MCQGGDGSGGTGNRRWDWKQSDVPPDWETIPLPPGHVLKHLTDAHCHPTDLDITAEEYNEVKLGGIGAMATVPEDQPKVTKLGTERGWSLEESGTANQKPGPKVVSCFGYHPWFTHRYSLLKVPPCKEDHYRSIFFQTSKEPNERNTKIIEMLLPHLPDPIPFNTLLNDLRRDIKQSVDEGRLTMLGEVGLDGGARMKWPKSARHLYEEKYPINNTDSELEGDEWNRLTPFKVSMNHQKAIVEAQLEIAIEMGVNVSFHSVAAPGPTMEVLTRIRNRHRSRFTNRINVDIHSGGGWSPEFWTQAEKQFLNLYASPSIFITSRTQSAPELIRAISPDRILVESDSNDVRLTSRLVWAATLWIAGCKGWEVENGQGGDWDSEAGSQAGDEVGADGLVGSSETIEVVRTLERNWARFMGLVDDTL